MTCRQRHVSIRALVCSFAISAGTLPAATPPARDYASEPRGDFALRRREVLAAAVAAAQPALHSQLARLALDRGPLDASAIRRATPFFPPSGPATGFLNGPHPKSKFLAVGQA